MRPSPARTTRNIKPSRTWLPSMTHQPQEPVPELERVPELELGPELALEQVPALEPELGPGLERQLAARQPAVAAGSVDGSVASPPMKPRFAVDGSRLRDVAGFGFPIRPHPFCFDAAREVF